MLLKATAVGFILASTPLFFVTPQDTFTGDDSPAALGDGSAVAELRSLREQVAAMRGELQVMRERCGSFAQQLEEALDMLEAAQTTERRSCSPSRSQRRSLLSQYQWMRKYGHDERAGRALARLLRTVGDDRDNLNRFSWHLMTETATQGQFDDVALVLADRMVKHGHLRHNHYDTIALAAFLNGDVDRAITMQGEAVKQKKNDSDYRRRLRTYEASKLLAAAAPESAPDVAKLVGEEEEE